MRSRILLLAGILIVVSAGAIAYRFYTSRAMLEEVTDYLAGASDDLIQNRRREIGKYSEMARQCYYQVKDVNLLPHVHKMETLVEVLDSVTYALQATDKVTRAEAGKKFVACQSYLVSKRQLFSHVSDTDFEVLFQPAPESDETLLPEHVRTSSNSSVQLTRLILEHSLTLAVLAEVTKELEYFEGQGCN